ncbi:GtrA family protein [Cupriavidus basilensis]|uniref:GtrA family protein n=1 Tax=Cupriavidus basilensis TaxID=68895 RepID=A0ABT6AZZ2_9BURK|nr:GtrA family protein [Cupriavidus basilensis]MDF3838059.1 GtrA family protein [Cupriavidus basilensis]
MINRQFIIFVGVGILSAAIDIAAMQTLIHWGIQYGAAVSAGFGIGLVFNYACHARITFRARSSIRTAFRFGIVVLSNYFITLAFVVISQHLFGSVMIGKIASLPVVAANGFILSRHWVFR